MGSSADAFSIDSFFDRSVMTLDPFGYPNTTIPQIREAEYTNNAIRSHECPPCQKQFTTSRALLRHLRENRRHRSQNSTDLDHRCPACPRSFARAYDRERHFREQHRDDGKTTCATCQRRTRRNAPHKDSYGLECRAMFGSETNANAFDGAPLGSTVVRESSTVALFSMPDVLSPARDYSENAEGLFEDGTEIEIDESHSGVVNANTQSRSPMFSTRNSIKTTTTTDTLTSALQVDRMQLFRCCLLHLKSLNELFEHHKKRHLAYAQHNCSRQMKEAGALADAIANDAALDVVIFLVGNGFMRSSVASLNALYASMRRKDVQLARTLFDCGLDIHARHSDFANLVGGSWSALHVAAYDGFLEGCQLLIERGAAVNTPSDEGKTALHLASGQGHSQIVESLVEAGANIDAVDAAARQSSLHVAITHNQAETAERLIFRGADVNVQDKWARRPLDCALSMVSFKFDRILRLLVERGSPITAEDVRKAILRGTYVGVVRLLMDKVSLNPVHDLEAHAWIHAACLKGRADILELLLNRGVKISHHGGTGYHALHEAASRADLEIIRVLFAHGVGLDAPVLRGERFGSRALKVAIERDDLRLAELLLRKGERGNTVNIRAGTQHSLLCDSMSVNMSQLLLLHGESVDQRCNRHERDHTALMIAAAGWRSGMARWLCDRGADVNATDRYGHTPLCYARNFGNSGHPTCESYTEVVRVLESKGAKWVDTCSCFDSLMDRGWS